MHMREIWTIIPPSDIIENLGFTYIAHKYGEFSSQYLHLRNAPFDTQSTNFQNSLTNQDFDLRVTFIAAKSSQLVTKYGNL